MMALVLHLGGVGEYVSQIWGQTVRSRESGNLHQFILNPIWIFRGSFGGHVPKRIICESGQEHQEEGSRRGIVVPRALLSDMFC
jgi:hypothetical protein